MDAMTKSIDVEATRRQLTSERDRLLELHASVDGTVADDLGELSSAVQHPADSGSETFERSKDDSIRAQLEAELADLERAIDRVDRGGYGECEACGGPIGGERLAARPTARFCVDDQAAYERDRSRNGAIR
jgi:RNA polymerase-binding transcription factor DksA